MTAADKACILRYATGVTLAVALAFGIEWTLSALAPILAASFLGNRDTQPGLKMTLGILLAIAVIFGLGLVLTLYLYPYPMVFLLLFSALLFRVYLAAASGKSAFVVLLYTMALLLLPLMGSSSSALAVTVAGGFLTSALVALLVVQVAHTVFPVPPSGVIPTPPPVPTHTEMVHSAWLSTAIVLPVALVCLVFSLTGAILPLIMIALLSQHTDFSMGAAGGKALIAANLGGGLVAVVFYQLLLINPSYLFVVTASFALALLFGRQLFSGKPTAPLYGSAFSTVLILIGTGTGAFGDEADSKFVARIVQILIAVCYLVAALSLLEHIRIREGWMNIGRWLRLRLERLERWMPGHQAQNRRG